MCIIDTNGEKSTVVSALINAQLTGSNSFFFFSYQMVLNGNPPTPVSLSPAPQESDTPPAVPADSCEDGRIPNHVRVTA